MATHPVSRALITSGVVLALTTLTLGGCGRDGATAVSPANRSARLAMSGSWPNEPAGLTVLSDEAFDGLNENGWQGADRDVTNGSGLSVFQDASAPVSPPNVLQFKYAAGFPGGVEPGVEWYDLAAPVKETYFAFWWKPSKPWQTHMASGVNKMAFILTKCDCADIYIMMFNTDSTDSTYTVQAETEIPTTGDVRRLPPNVAATPVTLGAWHLIEWYVKYSTTANGSDGIASWWLDGVLQGNYTDLRTPNDAGLYEYQLAPTWGGTGETKGEQDFYWYDHAHISVTPASRWPNEPAGFSVVTDEPFDALNENGWQGQQRDVINGSGLSLLPDQPAPFSPPNVLQFRYANGFPGGDTPGVEFYDLPAPTKETYFAFWWKPSDPWQNEVSSGANKMAYLMTMCNCADINIIMFNAGTGYTVQVQTEFPGDGRRLAPNVTATPVTLGTWHLIEWYVKYSTTNSSGDGITQWWLDGVLQGNYTDLHTPSDAGFYEYQLAPTWGGGGATKTETDFYWYDHAHVSQRP